MGEGRPDRGDGHLALFVDRVDRRTGLCLDHGLLGDDDRVPGLADLGLGLHIFTRQDCLLRIGDLRPDQEGGGGRVDRVVDDRRLARKSESLLSLEAGPEDFDGETPGDQPRHPVEVAGGDLDVDPHRVELPHDRQLGVVGAAPRGRGADEVAQLDLGQANPAVDRREHPTVAQVDLGIGDPSFRPGDVRPGGDDVRLVVRLGLLQAGLIGLDLRRVLLAERLLALDILDRGGVPLQQRLLTPHLDLGEREHRLAERELCRRDLPRLGVARLLQGGLGLLQCRLGLGEFGLEGLLVDDEQELALLDVGALPEVDLLEEPAHPGADGDLLEGPRRPDRLGHDRDGHPPGLDDGDHRGRRRPPRPGPG